MYYLAGELYDWVTDPRALEKLFHWNRARAVDRIIRRAGRAKVALDIGCGTGLITRAVVADRLVAVDINRWNLNRVKARIPRADIAQCDAEHLPFRDEWVDLAICTEVLEHLDSPRWVLVEVARVMKRGGKIVGSVPSNNPLWKFRNILSVTHPKSEPFHNNFSSNQFRSLFVEIFENPRVSHGNLFMNLLFEARRSNCPSWVSSDRRRNRTVCRGI